MQADRDGRDRQRQRHEKLQVEERIVHRGHEIWPNAQPREEHCDRDRRRGKQRQRQHEPDRPRAVRVIGGECSNELIGFHSYCSRSLAVRLASPRCSATRTAPSLIANFAAVSLIDALSTAIDCNTSRCRAGSDCNWAATSLAVAVSAAGSLGIISAKSSMLTKTRRPRRRSESISLLRAIANSHGANGALASQVCRFRCTANKMSCTMSSD